MKLDVSIDLDSLFAWEDETVATVIAEELRAVIRAQIKKAISEDADLKMLVKRLQTLAVKRAIAQLEGSK